MKSFLNHCEDFYRQLRDSVFCRENDWQADARIYRGDCSGLILTLLELYQPALLQALQQAANTERPKAFQIYDWLASKPHGVKLYSQLDDIKAGQLLAWRKVSPPASGDTGHLLVVLEVGEVVQQQLAIKVLDCSKQAHDSEDKDRPGIGCGWMTLSADANLEVNGYVWSKTLKKAKRTAIVIAELEAELG